MPSEAREKHYATILDNVFGLLASTDDREGPEFAKDEHGNDIRDDIRGVAMDICRKSDRYAKDPENIQRDLGAILSKRGIAPGSTLYSSITEGFKYITPEALDYMFATSSSVDPNSNPPKLKLGTAFTKENIKELSNCSDQKRLDIISLFNGMQKANNKKFADQSGFLGILFDEIYTKEGKYNPEAIKKGYEGLKYEEVEYDMDGM